MCWSPHVTLFFVVMECTCFTVLYNRGYRLLLIALGPLVLQEMGQLFLWWSIEEDERSGSCSMSNTRFTILELLIVGWLLPACGAVAGLNSVTQFQMAAQSCWTAELEGPRAGGEGEHVESTSSQSRLLVQPMCGPSSEEPALRESYQRLARRSRQDRALLVLLPPIAFLYILIGGGLWAFGAHARWPGSSWCSTRGVHGGHQLWPWVKPPLPPPVQRVFDSCGALIADVCFCWCLDWVPPSVHPHGDQACRWLRSTFSAAASYLLVYFPFWALYMGLPAYGIATLCYRGERMNRCMSDEHQALTRAAEEEEEEEERGAPESHLHTRMRQRCRRVVLPGPVHRGWLGCLAVVAAGPGVTIPAWMFWGAEYGSVWCWAASTALLAAIFEPWATAYAVRSYERAAAAPEEREEERKEQASSGRTRQPFWHLVLGLCMSPEQRLHDWRCHGPLHSAAFQRLHGQAAGPFDTHAGLRGSAADDDESGETREQTPREKKTLGERLSDCVDGFNRRCERQLDAIGAMVEEHEARLCVLHKLMR